MAAKMEMARVIPAEAGFRVGTFFDPDVDPDKVGPDDIEEWFEPVIAWAITVELNEDGEAQARQFVRPISPKGDMSDGNYLIVYPDGQVKRHFDEAPVTMTQAKQMYIEERLMRAKR